jgi:hypothetical protein
VLRKFILLHIKDISNFISVPASLDYIPEVWQWIPLPAVVLLVSGFRTLASSVQWHIQLYYQHHCCHSLCTCQQKAFFVCWNVVFQVVTVVRHYSYSECWPMFGVYYLIHSVPGFGCMPVFMWLVMLIRCITYLILVALHRIKYGSLWMLNIYASHQTTYYKWLSVWPVKEILWQTLNCSRRKLFL